jgi:hypothetical protein
MRVHIQAITAALFLLLASCASIGLAPAKSFSERLAYSYGVNAGVRNAAANALEAGTLTIEDGEYVLKVTDETRTLLDSAKLASGAGDPSTAEGRLLLAINVLEQLQAYLNRKVTG